MIPEKKQPERPAWRWKVPDPAVNKKMGLLYEPGNWGDILKGTWTLLVVRAVARRRAPGKLVYLDPFAGAPTYPLVEPARERLTSSGVEAFAGAQARYTAGGLIASTAFLARDRAREEGAEPCLRIFDADAASLGRWKGLDGVEILALASGEEGFRQGAEEPDVALVDPYDLLDTWPRVLPPALALAPSRPVLLYAYNKSPRGGGHERAYGAFQKALVDGTRGRSSCVLGRIPSDAIAPRAFHEMVLAGPEAVVAPIRGDLAAATRSLARALAEVAAYEEVTPGPSGDRGGPTGSGS